MEIRLIWETLVWPLHLANMLVMVMVAVNWWE